jgi:hypothetical protein
MDRRSSPAEHRSTAGFPPAKTDGPVHRGMSASFEFLDTTGSGVGRAMEVGVQSHSASQLAGVSSAGTGDDGANADADVSLTL